MKKSSFLELFKSVVKMQGNIASNLIPLISMEALGCVCFVNHCACNKDDCACTCASICASTLEKNCFWKKNWKKFFFAFFLSPTFYPFWGLHFRFWWFSCVTNRLAVRIKKLDLKVGGVYTNTLIMNSSLFLRIF